MTDLFSLLFPGPENDPDLRRLTEEAEHSTALPIKKEPLNKTLKALKIDGQVEVTPDGARLIFSDDASYHAAVKLLGTMDAITQFAGTGWVPIIDGDTRPGDEEGRYTISFLEIDDPTTPEAGLEGPPTEEIVLTAAKFNGFADPNAPVKPPPTAKSKEPKAMKEAKELLGGQPGDRSKPSGMTLHKKVNGNEIILKDEEGKLERWFLHPSCPHYAIVVDGNTYEFVHSLKEGEEKIEQARAQNTAMTLSDKVRILAKITTRDEAGRHFTSLFRSSDLAELESDGLITIDRPKHHTGIPYSEEYYTVEVTPDGVDLVEANPDYAIEAGEEDTGITPNPTPKPEENGPSNNFGYTVDKHGIIRDPGQFEAEPRWLPYFVSCIMDGGCGDEIGGGEGDTLYNVIVISDEDRAVYPQELEGIYGIIVWQSDQGFWNKETYDSEESFGQAVSELEAEVYTEDDEPEDDEPEEELPHADEEPRPGEESADPSRAAIDRLFEGTTHWAVIVGNIGNVYSGPDEKMARATYKEYVDQSHRQYGRAAGEDVTLMQDGEPVQEYQGKFSKENGDE